MNGTSSLDGGELLELPLLVVLLTGLDVLVVVEGRVDLEETC
jgi:hypothetical protein